MPFPGKIVFVINFLPTFLTFTVFQLFRKTSWKSVYIYYVVNILIQHTYPLLFPIALSLQGTIKLTQKQHKMITCLSIKNLCNKTGLNAWKVLKCSAKLHFPFIPVKVHQSPQGVAFDCSVKTYCSVRLFYLNGRRQHAHIIFNQYPTFFYSV